MSEAIDSLAENPRHPDTKKLSGEEGLYRTRAGDYRVVYRIEDNRLLVLVVKVGHVRPNPQQQAARDASLRALKALKGVPDIPESSAESSRRPTVCVSRGINLGWGMSKSTTVCP